MGQITLCLEVFAEFPVVTITFGESSILARKVRLNNY